MAYEFNAAEIFDVACQIERNGADFYREMSGKISDKPIRKLLTDLALMEKAHDQVFESMKKELTSQEQMLTVFDPAGETVLYLKAMADAHVFNEDAGQDFTLPEYLSEKAKIIKIVRAATSLEWESISFYVGIKEFVTEQFGKKRIDDIIKEEMRHVRILSNQLTS
jgi:rubrerythrin